MASLLRQIVAGPRQKHPEAGLDLCYVTDNIIATSGPSSTYPQRAYRNPTDALVKFLDYKHGSKWAIWEFRAEGTGYPDSEVYNRIRHYPWPDHHPPPFSLIPNIMASMRDWLRGPQTEKGRVVVVHCKAGKGRSGTVATSYLISEEGWSVEDAMLRFTARRMRSGFGNGISIPSQVRWVGYVDWWTKHGKIYVESQIEILEVHIWGLRDGVKVAVEGYVDKGRLIKTFHTFTRHERTLMDDKSPELSSPTRDTPTQSERSLPLLESKPLADISEGSTPISSISNFPLSGSIPIRDAGATAALFRPSQPLILPTSDVNIDFERRNKAKYGLTMVTSVAHVWFNAFFESQYALQETISNPTSNASNTPSTQIPNPTDPPTSGVFSIHWDGMDGIKGSVRKGTCALDRLLVVWRTVPASSSASSDEVKNLPKIITQPTPGEPIPETGPANKNESSLLSRPDAPNNKDLGLRAETSSSAGVSRASSPASGKEPVADDNFMSGVKSHGPEGGEHIFRPDQKTVDIEVGVCTAHVDGLAKSEQCLPGQIIKE
ncbi:MAG: hypothetical protein Q9217_000512 [Psora testacea]